MKTNFNSSFIAAFSNEPRIIQKLTVPPYLKYVAALPCELDWLYYSSVYVHGGQRNAGCWSQRSANTNDGHLASTTP